MREGGEGEDEEEKEEEDANVEEDTDGAAGAGLEQGAGDGAGAGESRRTGLDMRRTGVGRGPGFLGAGRKQSTTKSTTARAASQANIRKKVFRAGELSGA